MARVVCGGWCRSLGPADVSGGGGDRHNGGGNGGGRDHILHLQQRSQQQMGNMGGMYSAPPQPGLGGYGRGRNMHVAAPGSQGMGYGGGGGGGMGAEQYGMGPGPGYVVFYDGRMQPQVPVHMLRGHQQMYPHQVRVLGELRCLAEASAHLFRYPILSRCHTVG